MEKLVGSSLDNTPVKFDPPNGINFFEELGWQPAEIEVITVRARKLGRAPWYLRPFTYLPQQDPHKPVRYWGGVIRFRHE
jgi:hypothetical protein